MKLLRTTALTAALMAIALPSLTSPAHAWRVGGWRGAGLGWRGGGWGWRGAGLGLAAAAVGTAAAASSYYGYGYPAYGYGYGYPAYGYGYGTGYGSAANTYAPAYSYGTGYGTGYIPPGPFTPAFGGTNGYGGYGTVAVAHPVTGRRIYATNHPVTGRRIYATAAGIRRH